MFNRNITDEYRYNSDRIMYVQFVKILGYLMFEARRLSEISILYTKHLLNCSLRCVLFFFVFVLDSDLFNIHVSLIENMFNTKLAYAFSSCNLNLFLAKDYCISLCKIWSSICPWHVIFRRYPSGSLI